MGFQNQPNTVRPFSSKPVIVLVRISGPKNFLQRKLASWEKEQGKRRWKWSQLTSMPLLPFPINKQKNELTKQIFMWNETIKLKGKMEKRNITDAINLV